MVLISNIRPQKVLARSVSVGDHVFSNVREQWEKIYYIKSFCSSVEFINSDNTRIEWAFERDRVSVKVVRKNRRGAIKK